MIIELTGDQSEWIEHILEGWKHQSLAERFADGATKVLVTETEVHLVIDPLAEEQLRLEHHVDEMKDDDELKEGEEWDLEVVSSAIFSLKSQLKGGKPVAPKE
jgi:hypothetical protein